MLCFVGSLRFDDCVFDVLLCTENRKSASLTVLRFVGALGALCVYFVDVFTAGTLYFRFPFDFAKEFMAN